MRILKLLIYSAVFFFGLIFIFSLFFPSDVRISKTTNMKTDQQQLLDYISDLNKWNEWNPLFQNMDATEMEPIDTSNGRVAAMKIKNTVIRITDIKPDGVIMEYSLPGKNNVNSGFHTIQYPEADSMVVQWYMDFKLKWYPWEKFSSLLYEKMYGEQMQKGLENLKQLREDNNQ